jgi:hypothetical protein
VVEKAATIYCFDCHARELARDDHRLICARGLLRTVCGANGVVFDWLRGD